MRPGSWWLSLTALTLAAACGLRGPKTGSPCADRAAWVRETSRRYDVSFTYPPACFPRRSSWDNSIEFVGEGTEFASWSLSEQFDEDNLQAFARRADEASPPAQPWLPALLKAPLIRGSSNVEIVYALAPATRP